MRVVRIWSEERMKKSKLFVAVVGIAMLVVCAAVSQAQVFPFEIYSDNYGNGYYENPDFSYEVYLYNGQIGEQNTAKFEIRNTSSSPDSIITGVYFENGTLLELGGLFDSSPGVEFGQPATPSELPSANDAPDWPFHTTVPGGDSSKAEAFSIDSDAPVANGVDPGEFVTVWFYLMESQDIYDAIEALGLKTLRIGLHIQSFPDGSSQAAINSNVPEPATMLLLGMGGLLLRRRRA